MLMYNMLIALYAACWTEPPDMPSGFCYQGEFEIVSLDYCEKDDFYIKAEDRRSYYVR